MHGYNYNNNFGRCAILINSFTSGGAERVVTTIVQHIIASQKSNIDIISMEKNDYYNIDRKITYLSHLTGKENLLVKTIWLVIFAFRLKRLAKANAIDVIQSHLYRANYVNILARILGSKHKTQIVNHGTIGVFKKAGVTGLIKYNFIRFFYTNADSIICVSRGMKHDIASLIGDEKKIRVIYNPFEIGYIKKAAREKIPVNEFIFKKQKKYIIFVGRLVALKRVEDLFKAYIELNGKENDIELIIMGDGPKRNTLEKQAKEKGIQEHVHFTGFVKNPYKYIKRSHVLVLTSSSEGFANVLVESMICETPVISTDCPTGPREILAPETINKKKTITTVEYSPYGILVPVGNISQIAKAIKSILSDNRMTCFLIKNGIKRVIDFDITIISNQYMEAINDCFK